MEEATSSFHRATATATERAEFTPWLMGALGALSTTDAHRAGEILITGAFSKLERAHETAHGLNQDAATEHVKTESFSHEVHRLHRCYTAFLCQLDETDTPNPEVVNRLRDTKAKILQKVDAAYTHEATQKLENMLENMLMEHCWKM